MLTVRIDQGRVGVRSGRAGDAILAQALENAGRTVSMTRTGS